MRHVVSLLALVATLATSACGPQLVDCEAIAAEQPDCVNDAAIASCERENAVCEERGSGEVLTLESCPLSFACSSDTIN